MNEMSSAEKYKLPYVLLLDRETGQAAAYRNDHTLICPLASQDLVAFAEANPSHEMPWSDAKHNAIAGRPGRELPQWAAPEVLQRSVLLWIRRGIAPDSYWASMPKS